MSKSMTFVSEFCLLYGDRFPPQPYLGRPLDNRLDLFVDSRPQRRREMGSNAISKPKLLARLLETHAALDRSHHLIICLY